MTYFAISTDDAATNTKFAESLSCDYPILADADAKVAAAYGVLMPGTTFAKRWTFYIGPDGKIIDIDRKVNPANSGADIAAHLKTLNVPQKK